MASVSSLDKDLARLRRSKYTSEAAAIVGSWIASTLGEPLPPGELMDVLKDGTILCRLANHLATPRQLRPKKSGMPFVQMENISHFLTFISSPPVSLPPHDRFLTVDLFEKKDPAQVLQCLGAFSRVAHNLNPSAFPDTIGGLKTAVTSSPTIGSKPPVPAKKVAVSAWSKPEQEGVTAPAWNVAQYGYMGGASQGNQGIMFGGRRQITNTPVGGMQGIPPAEKERRRKVEIEERERLRKQNDAEREALRRNEAEKAREASVRREAALRKQEEEKARRRQEDGKAQRQAEETARKVELRRLEDETTRKEEALRHAAALRRQKEEELIQRKKADEEEERLQRQLADEEAERAHAIEVAAEKRRWHDEAENIKAWQLEKERQREQERQWEERRRADEERSRITDAELARERERVRQLERELEKARERERLYEAEKEARRREETERMRREAADVIRHRTGERAILNNYVNPQIPGERPMPAHITHHAADRESAELEEERKFLQGAWARETMATPPITEPTDSRPSSLKGLPPRALPTPPRKLPPTPVRTVERQESWERCDDETLDSPGREEGEEVSVNWSRMSFLERERERERERQKEWERDQMETQKLTVVGLQDEYEYADDILDMY